MEKHHRTSWHKYTYKFFSMRNCNHAIFNLLTSRVLNPSSQHYLIHMPINVTFIQGTWLTHKQLDIHGCIINTIPCCWFKRPSVSTVLGTCSVYWTNFIKEEYIKLIVNGFRKLSCLKRNCPVVLRVNNREGHLYSRISPWTECFGKWHFQKQ